MCRVFRGPRVDAHTHYLSKTLPHVSIGPVLRLGDPNTDSVLDSIACGAWLDVDLIQREKTRRLRPTLDKKGVVCKLSLSLSLSVCVCVCVYMCEYVRVVIV